jgi:antitoxin (DNA-binding transcriptional repressor) of toxin-antitoxin stability system
MVHYRGMITATLQEAKAKLNSLVEAAQAGEEVVLLRGSTIVATLRPLSADDVELSPQLTDAQAQAFWDEIDEQPAKNHRSMSSAIKQLKTLK